MKLKHLAVAWILVLPAAVAAQAPAAKDPVSGNWVEDGTAFLRLRYDGKTVTGKIVAGRPTNLADIKTGSFDPATGLLKLEGDAKHPDTGASVHFVVEGKIRRDTIQVHGRFGSDSGSKTLVRKPVDPSSP